LDKYQRRQLIATANKIRGLGYDTTTEIESVFEQSEEKIFQLTTDKKDRFQPQVIGACLKSVFEKLEQGNSPGFSTGLANLDGLTGGLIKQDFKALGVLSELPIIIDDTPASIQNPSRMRSVLRRIQSERGSLGLVVMDYIQKLGDRAARNRAQAVGQFSGAFKDIAKEFDVPFVALAQINRGVESQANKRPTMADIKDSGDIEQDMDLGLLLYRDEYYNAETKDKGVMEINVAKNRNGATGVCKVLFEPTVGKFCDNN
jgi:replicative DNA helicase